MATRRSAWLLRRGSAAVAPARCAAKDDKLAEPITFASPEHMRDWLRTKPPGFGQGRAYDTALEDKLVQEMEASRRARAASAAASKGGRRPPTSAPQTVAGKPAKTEPPPPTGVLVWVGNLPRKRNVDRDLRAALRGVPGLLHIRAVARGSAKTREPECVGYAFFTFADLALASRFVREYNGQVVTFGKVERMLVCQLAESCGDSPVGAEASVNRGTLPLQPLQVRQGAVASLMPKQGGLVPQPRNAIKTGKAQGQTARDDLFADVGLLQPAVLARTVTRLPARKAMPRTEILEQRSTGNAIEQASNPTVREAGRKSSENADDDEAALERVVWDALEDADDLALEEEMAMTSEYGPLGMEAEGHPPSIRGIRVSQDARRAAKLSRQGARGSQTGNVHILESQIEALEGKMLTRAPPTGSRNPTVEESRGPQANSSVRGSKVVKAKQKEGTKSAAAWSTPVPSRLKKKERQFFTGVLSKYGGSGRPQ
eukprot:SM000053S17483  [mRNA]  locus=s53:592841:595283:- [translate_table: standard]